MHMNSTPCTGKTAIANGKHQRSPISWSLWLKYHRAWIALVAILVATTSGQTVGASEAAGLAGRLPPPKVALPLLPADGSGIYRLSLDPMVGTIPLTVMLDVREGKVVGAVAMPVHQVSIPWPVDASNLLVRNGQITGSMNVQVMVPYNTHMERVQRGWKGADYKLQPAASATIAITASVEGAVGSGTWTAQWSVKNLPSHYSGAPKGQVSVLREAARPLPAAFDIDLFCYAGLADLTPKPGVWLRATMKDGQATAVRAFVSPRDGMPGKLLTIKQSQFHIRDGKLVGRVEANVPDMEDKPFVLEFDGQSVGGQLVGSVTFVQGDVRVATSWLGLLFDVAAWRLSMMEFPKDTWTWEHDVPADPALTAQAQAEALRPVMPGEPGKTGFWNWRSMMHRSGNQVSVIYPPSFDVQETAGAARYRYTVTGARHATVGVRAEFTDEKPWRSLAPVWKDLKPGLYRLTVTPLDAAGKDLPGKMRVGIQDKKTAQPSAKELDFINISKRPSFSGPYVKPRGSWAEIALMTSRWHRDMPGMPDARGQQHSTALGNGGGESFFAWYGAKHLWSNLANRALTSDPIERQLSEQLLAFYAEEMEIHQRFYKPAGMFWGYKGYTPLSRWAAEAVIDAYLQTGDERWKKIAMNYGKALVSLQKENGAFGHIVNESNNRDKATVFNGPVGFFCDFPAGNPEFGASELLYTLGRLRRDLKTEEFIEAEKKALGWMRDRAVRERFFPIYVHHSMSQGYPVWQHSMSALFFVRYLLECAPAESRDVKLAEEVARWAEDFGVDWTRALAGPQKGTITPLIRAGDRMGSEPGAVNLLAAIAFKQLARATGDKLWAAKGDALANAVSQAVCPNTGYLSLGLAPAVNDSFEYQFANSAYLCHTSCHGWAIQLLREYAAANAQDD